MFTILRFFYFCPQYTVAFMGYDPEDKNTAVELTYNYGVKEYDKGNGYAQVWIPFLVQHFVVEQLICVPSRFILCYSVR